MVTDYVTQCHAPKSRRQLARTNEVVTKYGDKQFSPGEMTLSLRKKVNYTICNKLNVKLRKWQATTAVN